MNKNKYNMTYGCYSYPDKNTNQIINVYNNDPWTVAYKPINPLKISFLILQIKFYITNITNEVFIKSQVLTVKPWLGKSFKVRFFRTLREFKN